MSEPIWIIEDLSNGTWRFNQPYKIYKSAASAQKGLERIRKEVGTRIPIRITQYAAVEDK